MRAWIISISSSTGLICPQALYNIKLCVAVLHAKPTTLLFGVEEQPDFVSNILSPGETQILIAYGTYYIVLLINLCFC